MLNGSIAGAIPHSKQESIGLLHSLLTLGKQILAKLKCLDIFQGFKRSQIKILCETQAKVGVVLNCSYPRKERLTATPNESHMNVKDPLVNL